MGTRRGFFKKMGVFGALGMLSGTLKSIPGLKTEGPKPLLVATWPHGLPAVESGFDKLENGGSVLDAVEVGVRIPESDPKVRSVGMGGFPDRDGIVSLDACIMDQYGNCGSVASIRDIENPISVARLVMEKTPHVMLVGKGAKEFAQSQGFPEVNLLTEDTKKDYLKWLETAEYKPLINSERHDTIGMLALDREGNLSGACTTSGMAWKMSGRVGDSPIIGAGLFVDNQIGAATATGVGEEVIKICGSHLVVELMRQGYSPNQACRLAVERITSRNPRAKDLQVGFLAINKNGEYGAFSIHKGFNFAIKTKEVSKMEDASYHFK